MTFWTPDEANWQKEETGPFFATMWGNPKKGPHAGLVKFTRGTTMPLHTHTADHVGVLVSGTVIIGDETGTDRTLTPGTTLNVPGMVKHTTRCAPEADCVIFAYVSGKDTTKPVDIAVKDKTASN